VPIVLIGVLDLGAQCGNCKLDVGVSPFAKEKGLCDKGMKDFGVFRGQLGRSSGGVEVHRGPGGDGILRSKLDREVVKHGLNAVFHVDVDLATVAKIKVHCKVMMEVATGLFYFAAMAAHGLKPVSEFIIY